MKTEQAQSGKTRTGKSPLRTVAWMVALLAAVAAHAGDFRVTAEGGRAEIQQAIDAAAAAGGGRVVVAPGVHPIGSLRFIGNHDSILSNIRLENFTAEVKAKTPFEAVATEPLTFRNCTLNGAKMPDGDLVTPRGKRKPFIRSKGVSWETLNQSTAK